MKKIKRVFIVYNGNNTKLVSLLHEMQNYLKTKSITADFHEYHGATDHFIPEKEYDLVISMGGDGTFLYSTALFAKSPLPIFPINAGKLGFISEIDVKEWREGLDLCLDGVPFISERILLNVEITHKTGETSKYSGINEAVISSGGPAKLVRLSLRFAEADMGDLMGDGIIIATPTGSTGYSMAAGGPIVDPESEALIVTPISPFSLSHRPFVLSGKDVIEVEVQEDQRTKVNLTVDGQFFEDLHPGDIVRIRQRKKKLPIVMSKKRNFFEVVRIKLRWSGGVNA